MAKAPKPTAKLERSALSTALDHVIVATTGPADYAQFCKFEQSWIIGYDGIVAAGHKVSEYLSLAPNTDLFRHAVLRAGSPFSITAKPDGTVVVSGHKVRAVVPTFPVTGIPNVVPDHGVYPVSEAFRRVLIDTSAIVAVRAETVIGSATLLRNNSIVATDGETILEGWHGCSLPIQALVPKEFCVALGKIKVMPTSIGWGADTLTVWFGDTAWLRTNIYDASKFPDTDVIFARMRAQCQDLRPVPPEMLGAIEMLKPFRETAKLSITEYGLNTREDLTGASFSYAHYLPYRGQYPIEALKAAAAHGQWIAFCREGAFWYGPAIRGATSLRG